MQALHAAKTMRTPSATAWRWVVCVWQTILSGSAHLSLPLRNPSPCLMNLKTKPNPGLPKPQSSLEPRCPDSQTPLPEEVPEVQGTQALGQLPCDLEAASSPISWEPAAQFLPAHGEAEAQEWSGTAVPWQSQARTWVPGGKGPCSTDQPVLCLQRSPRWASRPSRCTVSACRRRNITRALIVVQQGMTPSAKQVQACPARVDGAWPAPLSPGPGTGCHTSSQPPWEHPDRYLPFLDVR